MEKNIQAYKKAFGTMDKIKQVVMLYEVAIASLHQAKVAIEEKNLHKSYNKIEKAYLIVSGLRDCVDTKIGEEVAQTLVDWYSSLSLRIISINKMQDVDLCDLCIDNLKEMREAWVEAEQVTNQQEYADKKSQSQQKDKEMSQSMVGKQVSSSADLQSYNSSGSISSKLGDEGEVDDDKASLSNSPVYSQSLLEGLSLSI